MFIQGTSLLLEDIGSEDPEVTLETLRTLLRMIEEKTRLVQLLDDYLGGAGLTVVIGSEHHAPDLRDSASSPRRIRTAHHRRRRRHRPDADAVFARDQCRRHAVAGDQPNGRQERRVIVTKHPKDFE